MTNPVDQDPFNEGFEAYGRNEPRESCPYPEGSDERKNWEEGWDEAKSLDEDGGPSSEN